MTRFDQMVQSGHENVIVLIRFNIVQSSWTQEMSYFIKKGQ